MKTLITITIILVAVTSFLTKGFATGLSDAEKEGIKLMCEEEKLAQDVYLYLYDQWKLPIYNNISNSETRHFVA